MQLPISILVYCYDYMPIFYFFPRYNNLLVEYLHFLLFIPSSLSFKDCTTAVTNNNFVQCPCNSHCDSVTLIFAFVCMYVCIARGFPLNLWYESRYHKIVPGLHEG